MFYFDEINGKKILKSDILETEHFFTTRECCIYSKEPESEEIVNNNREIVRKYLRVDRLISPNQTHTPHVELAVKDKTFYPDTDGLIVKDKDFAIFLNFADCPPVIIYDKVKHIGAVSHAGWRGTSGEISKKTALKILCMALVVLAAAACSCFPFWVIVLRALLLFFCSTAVYSLQNLYCDISESTST